MVWLKRLGAVILLILVVAVVAILATGNANTARMAWDIATNAPQEPFIASDQPGSAPDYSAAVNWAALPATADLADVIPRGLESGYAPGAAPVDVFFVHPTGFLKGSSWTFSMNPDTSTEENTQWMMINQASAYNGCCNVYAPRYRQASMYTYLRADEDTSDAVMAFAYADVERAFLYFLKHYNDGRPFIIASHSQGTHHSVELLRNIVDDTVLAERLVAAYLIGGFVSRSEFEALNTIDICDSATQLSCIVHWDTYSIATLDESNAADTLCVNPLTWRIDGDMAERAQHRGAVKTSGEYHASFRPDDSARGVVFAALEAPLRQHTWAKCAGGRLYIEDQSETAFAGQGEMAGTYHGLDYAMFYVDIRENALQRSRAYLRGRPQ